MASFSMGATDDFENVMFEALQNSKTLLSWQHFNDDLKSAIERKWKNGQIRNLSNYINSLGRKNQEKQLISPEYSGKIETFKIVIVNWNNTLCYGIKLSGDENFTQVCWPQEKTFQSNWLENHLVSETFTFDDMKHIIWS